jgi:hypothetical protein
VSCGPIVAHRLLHAVFSKVNTKRQWYEMPTVGLKALNLLSLRLDLRDLNLFDTGTPIRRHGLDEPPPEVLTARRPDGKWNDLEDPEMGSTEWRVTGLADVRAAIGELRDVRRPASRWPADAVLDPRRVAGGSAPRPLRPARGISNATACADYGSRAAVGPQRLPVVVASPSFELVRVPVDP